MSYMPMCDDNQQRYVGYTGSRQTHRLVRTQSSLAAQLQVGVSGQEIHCLAQSWLGEKFDRGEGG